MSKQKKEIVSFQPKLIFQPNKKLGQNFLFNEHYLKEIIKNIFTDSSTIIIEIGSGYGKLTNLLSKTNCQKVISIEKDNNLFQWLTTNNKDGEISYLHQDALQINWPEFCSRYNNSSIVIVGNLPYYITNYLIVDLLFNYRLFKSLVFLVQKEVGEKWVSSPNNKYSSQYSALSVFVNYLAEAKIVLEVPAQVFTPSPLVDGALVVINPYQNIDISKEQLTSFLRFLKNCFRFRRKTLLNNLNGFAGNYKKEWEKYFIEKGYSNKIRPQNLTSLEYWQLFLFWQKLS